MEYLKDSSGWTWYHPQTGAGWTLLRHEEYNCYVDLPIEKVQAEYGPLRPLNKYEQIYFKP